VIRHAELCGAALKSAQSTVTRGFALLLKIKIIQSDF
jgi:hypothetical protein